MYVVYVYVEQPIRSVTIWGEQFEGIMCDQKNNVLFVNVEKKKKLIQQT